MWVRTLVPRRSGSSHNKGNSCSRRLGQAQWNAYIKFWVEAGTSCTKFKEIEASACRSQKKKKEEEEEEEGTRRLRKQNRRLDTCEYTCTAEISF